MPSAAPGWAVAMEVRDGPLETCDQCGYKTTVLYRPQGEINLHNMVCGICMDEECESAPSTREERP